MKLKTRNGQKLKPAPEYHAAITLAQAVSPVADILLNPQRGFPLSDQKKFDLIYAGNFLNQLSDSEIPAYIDTVNEKLKYILIFKLDHSDDCRPTTTFALRSPEVYMKLISESESFKQNKIKIAFETFTINKYPELVIIIKRIVRDKDDKVV